MVRRRRADSPIEGDEASKKTRCLPFIPVAPRFSLGTEEFGAEEEEDVKDEDLAPRTVQRNIGTTAGEVVEGLRRGIPVTVVVENRRHKVTIEYLAQGVAPVWLRPKKKCFLVSPGCILSFVFIKRKIVLFVYPEGERVMFLAQFEKSDDFTPISRGAPDENPCGAFRSLFDLNDLELTKSQSNSLDALGRLGLGGDVMTAIFNTMYNPSHASASTKIHIPQKQPDMDHPRYTLNDLASKDERDRLQQSIPDGRTSRGRRPKASSQVSAKELVTEHSNPATIESAATDKDLEEELKCFENQGPNPADLEKLCLDEIRNARDYSGSLIKASRISPPSSVSSSRESDEKGFENELDSMSESLLTAKTSASHPPSDYNAIVIDMIHKMTLEQQMIVASRLFPQITIAHVSGQPQNMLDSLFDECFQWIDTVIKTLPHQDRVELASKAFPDMLLRGERTISSSAASASNFLADLEADILGDHPL